MIILLRIKNFLYRCWWLSPFTGGAVGAFFAILSFKFKPGRDVRGQYNGKVFYFRGGDCSAVQEVLSDSEYAFLTSTITGKPAPVVLDMGAHIGTFALWIFSQNRNAHIYSIEASPSTFAILERNQKEAGFESWHILNRAAYGEQRNISFKDSIESMSGRIRDGGNVEIETVTLDSILKNIVPEQFIDCMKVDIEGAEESFICTQPDLLNRINSLVIELHPHYCDVQRVQNVLEKRYNKIIKIGGRKSNKPLLFCFNES